MKKQIPIFIAGAKSFRDQRVALKAMANDLNTEFSDQKKDVVIYMCSYENFGDHQQEYNQFIADVADLVIFVLDGSIGKHTEDEFRLAVSEYKKEDMPKVLVFLKEFDQTTPGIQKIQHLLEEAFGPEFYYISYSSTEDLCTKAKERIQQHVNRYQHRINTIRRAIAAGFVFLLMIACFITATFFSNKDNRTRPEPSLIFVGGGSASNYLDSCYHYDVRHNKQEKNSLFINMPSLDSYSLLTDWILEHKNNDTIDNSNNFFYPISLSASSATPKLFTQDLKNVNELSDNGIIFSYFMGYDTLCVHFCVRDTAHFSILKADTIDTDNLIKWLSADPTIVIYTTRDHSGTFNTYDVLLDSIFSKNGIAGTRDIYYKENSFKELFDKKKDNGISGFVVLASNYYQPCKIDIFDQENPDTYYMRYLKHNDRIQRKSMNIYFPALRISKTHTTYQIPTVAQRFINAVDSTVKLQDIYEINTIRDTMVIHSLRDPED
jgi:hypothetical protein